MKSYRFILENPALFLKEIRKKLFDATSMLVSPSTICRLICRHGFTRKKIQQIATQRRYDYRGDFMAEVSFYRQDQFVWIDESGCDKRDNIRKFGYAIQGCLLH
jgi:hypothetical protein